VHKDVDIQTKFSYVLSVIKQYLIKQIKSYQRRVQTQLDRFQRDIQTAVMKKVKGPLGSVGADMGRLDGIGRGLTCRLTAGEDILKADVGGKPDF